MIGRIRHRLDFWLGEWDVFVGDREVGENRIEKIVGGCALLEHWSAVGRDRAHRFYFREGMQIASFHFSMPISRETDTGA